VWRGALDVGEYNAGTLAQALKVNQDIPENAQLLDAVFFSDTGPDAENETGTRDLPTSADGTVMQANQIGFVTHVRLPIAYFASNRLLLQAGPQLDLEVGSYTPNGGDSQSFSRIAGGFAVGGGYAF